MNKSFLLSRLFKFSGFLQRKSSIFGHLRPKYEGSLFQALDPGGWAEMSNILWKRSQWPSLGWTRRSVVFSRAAWEYFYHSLLLRRRRRKYLICTEMFFSILFELQCWGNFRLIQTFNVLCFFWFWQHLPNLIKL